MSAEGAKTPVAKKGEWMLQWGRALVSAEGAVVLEAHGRAVGGFNGAALW